MRMELIATCGMGTVISVQGVATDGSLVKIGQFRDMLVISLFSIGNVRQ